MDHQRMRLLYLSSDFDRPIREMLNSNKICASWTCEDFLHFTETVSVLVLRDNDECSKHADHPDCVALNETIHKKREEGYNHLTT
eukprot:jgi/Tetstr1/446439/TSEL_033981.t1